MQLWHHHCNGEHMCANRVVHLQQFIMRTWESSSKPSDSSPLLQVAHWAIGPILFFWLTYFMDCFVKRKQGKIPHPLCCLQVSKERWGVNKHKSYKYKTLCSSYSEHRRGCERPCCFCCSITICVFHSGQCTQESLKWKHIGRFSNSNSWRTAKKLSTFPEEPESLKPGKKTGKETHYHSTWIPFILV